MYHRMNRVISLSIVLLIYLTFLTSHVSAHSPSDMELDYDKGNNELRVTISHSVANTDSHYVEEIMIKKNGEDYQTETYSSQPDDQEFTYTYDVDASEEDTITVKANCNQGGDIESIIEITEEGVEEKDDTPFISLFLMILLAAITSLIYKKK